MPARDRSGRPVIVFVEYTDIGVVKAEPELVMGITFLWENLGRRCLGDGITTAIGYCRTKTDQGIERGVDRYGVSR